MQNQETWDGDATVDYWIWRDDHLVPVTSDATVQVPEGSRPRRSRQRLGQSGIVDLREARRTRRQRNAMYIPFMGYPPFVLPLLLAKRSRRRVSHKEGAHAKRTVTRRQAP
jgi:hypothetical protein